MPHFRGSINVNLGERVVVVNIIYTLNVNLGESVVVVNIIY